MAVNYVILKNRFKKGTGVGAKYIKCVSNYIVDTTDMARRISGQCTVTEADIQAVLQAYETNLKMMFAQGNSVRIFNLGTLKPCFKADFDSEGNVVKDSLRLSKVQLITNHSFMNDAKGYEYRCHGEQDDYCPDYDGRVKNMMDYFSQGFEEITAREYVYINDCSKTQACDDLRQLYAEEILIRKSYGNTMVYRLNENSEKNSGKDPVDGGLESVEAPTEIDMVETLLTVDKDSVDDQKSFQQKNLNVVESKNSKEKSVITNKTDSELKTDSNRMLLSDTKWYSKQTYSGVFTERGDPDNYLKLYDGDSFIFGKNFITGNFRYGHDSMNSC